jgi:hypothetical protein
MSALTNIITLDGYKYAVKANTYNKSWVREFDKQVAAAHVYAVFVDRGAGIQDYKMTLEIRSWPTDSLPYKLGVTQSWSQQLTNLETSYLKKNNSLQFIDPLGNTAIIPATGGPSGVYFVNYLQTIPDYATPDKPSINALIELSTSTLVVTIGP